MSKYLKSLIEGIEAFREAKGFPDLVIDTYTSGHTDEYVIRMSRMMDFKITHIEVTFAHYEVISMPPEFFFSRLEKAFDTLYDKKTVLYYGD